MANVRAIVDLALTRGFVGQVHWPEGNALIERGVSDPECGIPDFNTEVEIERIASAFRDFASLRLCVKEPSLINRQ